MSLFSRFTPISTALSPNAESDDIRLVLKLFLPWNWGKWKKGIEIEKLENKFKEYFGAKYAISFSSGRTGLSAILEAIAKTHLAEHKQKVQKFDDRNDNPTLGIAIHYKDPEIITQAYTTIALPNAIKWAGFKVVYCDIDGATCNIDPSKIESKITPQTQALLIQHTFGIPAEMDKISAITTKHDLYLIEDCAHSLGAEFDGKKIGSFGDAAFFSFGRDKIISAVSGGMVTTNDGSLAKKIMEYRDSLDEPSTKWIFQRLVHPLVFALSLPVYYFFNLGKIKIFLDQKIGMITRAYTPEEKRGSEALGCALPNALAIIALGQFNKMERFNEHRRSLARLYEEKLTNNSITKPRILWDRSKPTPLYYTIQIPARDDVLKSAEKNHIILGNWFPDALGPEGVDLEKFGYKRGECPESEKAGRSSLNLPTNIKTSILNAQKVIELINSDY